MRLFEDHLQGCVRHDDLFDKVSGLGSQSCPRCDLWAAKPCPRSADYREVPRQYDHVRCKTPCKGQRRWAPRAVQCVYNGRPNPVQDLSNIHNFLSNVPMEGAKTLGNGGQYFSPSDLIIILEWGNEAGRAFVPQCPLWVHRTRNSF